MKRTIVLLVVCTTLSFSLTKSKVQWLTPTSHDFGTISQGEPVEHLFKFKNISDISLTIDNVRTTCGCTAPDWNETEVIMPDSTGTIILEFDAKATGYFYKMAKVWLNGQNKAEKLFIEGEVLPNRRQ